MTATLTPGQQAHRRYIASPEWERTRYWWWHTTPRRRRHCRARSRRCSSGPVELHHRTYRRAYVPFPFRALGRERRRDLAPLCRHHHGALHDYARSHHMSVETASRYYLWSAWARRQAVRLAVAAAVLLVLVALVGCGQNEPRDAVVRAAAAGQEQSYLPLAAGQSWHMADQQGRVTTFTALPDPRPGVVRLRITKADAGAYWWAGVSGAWLDFYLQWTGDTWAHVQSDVHVGENTVTFAAQPVEGQPPAYLLYPPGGIPGSTDSQYRLVTVGCATCAPLLVDWHAHSYITQLPGVGEVLATHFCEGPSCAYAQETWYFRAGVGLVRIHDVFHTDLVVDRSA